MERMGVVATQTERARVAFMRSAERAGFFDHGKDRLILPNVTAHEQHEESKPKGPNGHVPMTAAAPSALEAVWLTLLRGGADWTPEQTCDYVSAARQMYSVLAAS
jgi:hypothetical protein